MFETIKISIHAPRTGSDTYIRCGVPLPRISIHAPRTGSDALNNYRCTFAGYFNPRSPHGERLRHGTSLPLRDDFNPRSPHGERLCARKEGSHDLQISIHAPRTGSDINMVTKDTTAAQFQSTLPARGATLATCVQLACNLFQSTLPARGATCYRKQLRAEWAFQSTLPARGATCAVDQPHAGDGISIHAPRTGSDAPFAGCATSRGYFNPRSPHGERRFQIKPGSRQKEFQSTLPARGAT